MKSPSTRTISLCARNKPALGFAAALLAALLVIGAYPVTAPAVPAAPVTPVPGALFAEGVLVVEDEDLITLLALNLGGRDVAFAVWSNMNPSEKQTLRDQAARIVLMAQAAEREGLAASPDVARALWWGTSSFLADAWEKKISSEVDLSENTMKAFYETNQLRYMGLGSVRYRKAVYPASQKAVASRVKTALKKAPLSRLKNCVAVNWTEYDSAPFAMRGALRTSPAGVVVGPVETPEGHVLFEVLERRAEGPIPFEQCKSRVREDMVRVAIMERLHQGSGIR